MEAIEKQRVIQEYVPGKQVTLAHLIANPAGSIFNKLGLIEEYNDAIGILTITPSEAAIIASDVATKAAEVEIGFLDRFSGSLVITRDISSVESALKEVLRVLTDILLFTPTFITRSQGDREVRDLRVGGLVLEVKYTLMKQKNKTIGINMIIRDIIEVKAKEKEPILKSVAIQEIHHRIKNNLQTISSLLRLQFRRMKDRNAKKALEESISRIVSVSITHELLSESGIVDVDIKILIERIADNGKDYLLEPNKNIDIKVLGNTFVVDSQYATSIALIANELIQNSIDDGFKTKIMDI